MPNDTYTESPVFPGKNADFSESRLHAKNTVSSWQRGYLLFKYTNELIWI